MTAAGIEQVRLSENGDRSEQGDLSEQPSLATRGDHDADGGMA
jgi:hypothetical protein